MKNRIKELRKNLRLTQTDVAKKLNVTYRSVGFYESGERDPDTETLAKLSDLFNVSIDYILYRTDKPDLILREDNNVKYHIKKGHENDYSEEDLEMALKIIDMMKKEKK